MYKIKIGLKYGSFSVKSDTYKECMEKYYEIKDEYANIPAEITVYKDDKVQFVKYTGKKSFEKLKHEIEENRSQYDELKIYYGKKDNCTLDGLEEYLLNEE